MPPIRAYFSILALTLLLLLLTLLAGQVTGAPTLEPIGQPSKGLHFPISNPHSEHIIPNKYIVVYGVDIDHDKVAAHQAHWATTLAERNIGKRSLVDNRPLSTSVKTFSIGTMRAMALEADDASAIEINKADEVDYIEADQHIHLNHCNDDDDNYENNKNNKNNLITQLNSTTGLARLSSSGPGGTSYTFDDSAGEGITVFVLDTGIYTDHEDFEGRATMLYNAVDNCTTDQAGHGSHVAGTIGGKTFGVAKKVKLVGVKVMGMDIGGTTSTVIDGMNFVSSWVQNNSLAGRSVVNLSLGAPLSGPLNDAINQLRTAGILPVVAAGNQNTDVKDFSPASALGAITVGAINQTSDERASFSNFGQLVDVFAPGINVESVGIRSTNDTEIMSGTSMASPHVAGLAAYLMALENITDPDALAARITALAGADVLSWVWNDVNGTTTLIASNGVRDAMCGDV